MAESEHPNLDQRFGGISRLYGAGAHAYLNQQVHAMVVGVGGVGSWAAEALARSGVGHITLVDMDHVAESNINRQIQACDSNLGREKIKALADHIHGYFPQCQITLLDAFLEPDNAQALLAEFAAAAGEQKVLLDCCDNVRAKVAMVTCQALEYSCGAVGQCGWKNQALDGTAC